MVIGMAAASRNMQELKERLAERFGRVPVQLTLYLPVPEADRSSSHLPT
jgi:hypothetical protein